MSARSSRRHAFPLSCSVRMLTTALLAVGLLAAAPAAATGSQVEFHDNGDSLALTVPAGADTPGYAVVITNSPFQVTTRRDGGTVLQTVAAAAGSSGPVDFRTASGWATATSVQSSTWHDGVLDLTLASTAPGDTVAYRITPQPDRYRMTWSVQGPMAPDQVATHYRTAASGHWYGQGEAQTADGGPYTRQPWPLDSGKIRDTAMGPAEYLMTDPFWFTQRGTGLWVDTRDVMDVAMNSVQQGVFGYTLTNSTTMDTTAFVERTPR
ncbi:MAG TPA: hypothetical protein VE442_07840, partial [Jatrophihabitans sp.]|nr:hypothetical protein [Jatrophihabitans sp.]